MLPHLLVPNELHTPVHISQTLLQRVEPLLQGVLAEPLHTARICQTTSQLLCLILQRLQAPANKFPQRISFTYRSAGAEGQVYTPLCRNLASGNNEGIALQCKSIHIWQHTDELRMRSVPKILATSRKDSVIVHQAHSPLTDTDF